MKKNIIYLSSTVSWVINITCVCFVTWKTTQCFIKFFDEPQGTHLDIKKITNIDHFPRFTICAVNSDEDDGMRWNISHLNFCGIG